MIGAHDIRKTAHGVERRQVGRVEHGGAAAATDLGDHLIAALAIPAVHYHACAGATEPERHEASDAIGRPGDEESLAGGIRGRARSSFRSNSELVRILALFGCALERGDPCGLKECRHARRR